MKFVNAINIEDETRQAFNGSSAANVKPDLSGEGVDDYHSTATEMGVVKGLLGKGKSRVVFSVTLKMARAQILLMNEDETKLTSLLQDNLQTDIKVC